MDFDFWNYQHFTLCCIRESNDSWSVSEKKAHARTMSNKSMVEELCNKWLNSPDDSIFALVVVVFIFISTTRLPDKSV